MQSLRRITTCSSRRILATIKAQPIAAFRNFSTPAKIEETNKFHLKDQIEAILSSPDGGTHKTQLESIARRNFEASKFGDVEAGKSPAGYFVNRFGLDDWKMQVPLALGVGIMAVEQDYLMLSEEVYVCIAAWMFAQISMKYGKAPIAKMIEERTNKIKADIKSGEENLLMQIKADIETDKEVIDIDKALMEVHEIVDNMHAAQAEVLTAEAEYLYRDAIVKKLDTLVVLEESAMTAIRKRMLTTVQDEVLETFKSDKKAKEMALNSAIAVLTSGASAKMGEDVVGKAFASAVKSYREGYAKKPAGSDEIIRKLEKDIATVLMAPSVDVMGKGGNVYETHPVSPRFVA